MVVRDEHGNIVNPDITSAVKLFRFHQDALEALNRVTFLFLFLKFFTSISISV